MLKVNLPSTARTQDLVDGRTASKCITSVSSAAVYLEKTGGHLSSTPLEGNKTSLRNLSEPGSYFFPSTRAKYNPTNVWVRPLAMRSSGFELDYVWAGGLTMSTMGSTPLFKVTKQMSPMSPMTVYNTAASMSMRTIGSGVLLVVRTSETFRSIVQMRYASNPGHVQGCDAAFAGMRSPELVSMGRRDPLRWSLYTMPPGATASKQAESSGIPVVAMEKSRVF
ncbi:hypothetical protein EDD22DRAFT_1001124 [Suillus occidentalis]|nr:hypothetical protein EDD22DRAFT_1001124 [Suillus occidentalis]